MVNSIKKKSSRVQAKILKNYCSENLKAFLKETTLHGLKFLAEKSITIWEKFFFLVSFVVAFIATTNLILNIYAKWISTPVIIGISPHPTSILQTPFPAITVCNMNQVLASKVSNYSEDSFENALLKLLCFTDTEMEENLFETLNFKNNTLKISDFLIMHTQPCSKMLLSCTMGSTVQNCSDLFHEILTDEGLCCVFNILHPYFLYKGNNIMIRDYDRTDKSVPVNWDPETGYPQNLPDNFYPRPASGTGVSMGLSLVINAELDEYFCSSTNGPGFKIGFHNAMEIPDIKETAITVPIGSETRFRIDVLSSEAMPTIRSLHRNERQCLFNNEESLIYFKHYTRRNCETECQAKFLLKNCKCIPYNMPLIYNNASMCNVKDSACSYAAEDKWKRRSDSICRKRCLPGCFDLNYRADSFSTPLADRNFTTPNSILRRLSKVYVNHNLAVIHLYYRETIFHGDLKNVYVGFTEFLSNTGGIMGLFLGFSFISLAEIFYFSCLRPISDMLPNKNKKNQKKEIAESKKNLSTLQL